MNTQGRKEIAEAVLIAALSALCGACITWGAEEVKKVVAARREVTVKKQDEETPGTTDA